MEPEDRRKKVIEKMVIGDITKKQGG